MPEPRPQIRPGVVLALASAATFVAFLDVTVVNVALPDLRHDFSSSSLALLSWVVSGYAVVFAAALTPAGRLADGIGRKAAFLGGFTAFTLASGASAIAPDVWTLIAMRVLQGLGAAFMIPSALGIVLATAAPERRPAAVGLWGAATSIAAAAGPSLGGVLVDAFGWRSVFVINLPLGAAVVALGLRHLPDLRPTDRSLPDLPGAVALGAGFALVAGGLTEVGERGWTDWLPVTLAGAGVLTLAPALARARRHPRPALDVALWRERAFAQANAGSMLLGVALYAWLLSGVLFLTAEWGYSILDVGLAVSPGAVASAATAIVAGRIIDRRGPYAVTAVASLVMAAAGAWITLGADGHPNFLGLWMWTGLLSGIGFGAMSVGLTAAAARTLPPAAFAAGAGLNMTARQLGGAVGVALLASILERTPGLGGYHAVFLLCTGAALVVGVGAVVLAPRAAALAAAPAAEQG